MGDIFRSEDDIACNDGNFDSNRDNDEEYNTDKERDEYSDCSFHSDSSYLDNTDEKVCNLKIQRQEKKKEKIAIKFKKKSNENVKEKEKGKEATMKDEAFKSYNVSEDE